MRSPFSFIMLFEMCSICSSEIFRLTCNEGDCISFDCPCTEGFQYCRFKKFGGGGGGLIVRDGLLAAGYGEKYEVNGSSRIITLKGCRKEDEGVFVSMCGGSDINKQLELKVVPPLTVETTTKTITTGSSLGISVVPASMLFLIGPILLLLLSEY